MYQYTNDWIYSGYGVSRRLIAWPGWALKYILPEIYFKPDSNILKPKLRTEILTLDDIFCSIDKIFQNVEVKLRMNKKLDDLNLHLILELVGWLSKQTMKHGKIWDPDIQGSDLTELRPDLRVTIEKMYV